MSFTNIEIKARVDQPEEIRDRLSKVGAVFSGSFEQTDTYFNIQNGRLKLRESQDHSSLIWYKRDNQLGPKEAEGKIYSPSSVANLKDLLTSALGEKVTVNKVREIYTLQNIVIHLDSVKELGIFMEIEARSDDSHTIQDLTHQCEELITQLSIKPTDLVTNSYSDLLLK